MEHTYTMAEAAAALPEARERIGGIAAMTAQLQRLGQAIDAGDAPEGAIPDAKALQARIDEAIGWFRERGIQIKGIAPALLDFPARAVADGRELDVLLCWREGEDGIGWYHPAETGYLGREPVASLDDV